MAHRLGLLLPLLLGQICSQLLGTSGNSMLHYWNLRAENGSWGSKRIQDNVSVASAHTLLFSLDYQHVQTPFEITLWIMLASLAKIGKWGISRGFPRELPNRDSGAWSGWGDLRAFPDVKKGTLFLIEQRKANWNICLLFSAKMIFILIAQTFLQWSCSNVGGLPVGGGKNRPSKGI